MSSLSTVDPPLEGGLRSWALANLARPRAAQEFVPQIDGLRFIAIMAVVFYHVHGFVLAKAGFAGAAQQGLLMRLIGEGSFGVPLFFAISGYILCRPFLGGRTVSLKRYFTRRLSRLEPPFLISLFLVFAAKVFFLGMSASQLAPNLAASLIYSHNLIYGFMSLVNGVTWSLEVEWQFYVLAPLAFAAVARSSPGWRNIGLLALIVAGGWVFADTVDADPRLRLSLVRYFGFFAAGMWVATLDEDHPGFGRNSTAFDLLGAIAWFLLAAVLLGGDEFMWLLPILTALVVLSGIRGLWFARLLGWWPIYCIGAMCYTIYLYHFFVISLVGHLVSGMDWWPASPLAAFIAFSWVAVPAVVAACLIPYIYIERPFMIWRPGKNRFADAFRRAGIRETT